MSKSTNKGGGCLTSILGLILIGMILGAIPYVLAFIACCVILVSPFFIYAFIFFRSEKFLSIKEGIKNYIQDCNELNEHINSLKDSFVDFQKVDYGEVTYNNTSKFNYQKKNLQDVKYAPNIYECSKTVCDNARKQPFKYLCKYFNIKEDEKTINDLNEILNNFVAADEGKQLLKNKKDEILNKISNDIPFLIKKAFPKKLARELGFDEYHFDEVFYPRFTFRYVSSGGNSGNEYTLTLDIEMLERFITFISSEVDRKKSASYQRQLMTPALRRKILQRDNNTCKFCNNSTYDEPNLLLEVDHIVPISKGGITTEENLQTLCWKCNRSKSAKIITA